MHKRNSGLAPGVERNKTETGDPSPPALILRNAFLAQLIGTDTAPTNVARYGTLPSGVSQTDSDRSTSARGWSDPDPIQRTDHECHTHCWKDWSHAAAADPGPAELARPRRGPDATRDPLSARAQGWRPQQPKPQS